MNQNMCKITYQPSCQAAPPITKNIEHSPLHDIHTPFKFLNKIAISHSGALPIMRVYYAQWLQPMPASTALITKYKGRK
jgi:hypothetical protein